MNKTKQKTLLALAHQHFSVPCKAIHVQDGSLGLLFEKEAPANETASFQKAHPSVTLITLTNT